MAVHILSQCYNFALMILYWLGRIYYSSTRQTLLTNKAIEIYGAQSPYDISFGTKPAIFLIISPLLLIFRLFNWFFFFSWLVIRQLEELYWGYWMLAFSPVRTNAPLYLRWYLVLQTSSDISAVLNSISTTFSIVPDIML